MSLQLYQVDHKSYLLDFKSLSSEEEDIGRGKLSLLIIIYIVTPEISPHIALILHTHRNN